MYSCLFLFKEKTVYDRRISDWSSDVCSSDLAGDRLADRAGHGLSAASQMGGRDTAESGSLALGSQQKDALAHITGKNDLAIVVGYAGTGKSTMLGVARDEWERAGYQERGAALSGISAEGLEGGSGNPSRTMGDQEYPRHQTKR